MTQKQPLESPNDNTNSTKVRSFQLLYSKLMTDCHQSSDGPLLVRRSLSNTHLYLKANFIENQIYMALPGTAPD